MCRSTVDIQSATAENRRGKRKKKEKIKKKEEEIRKKTTAAKYNGLPYSIIKQYYAMHVYTRDFSNHNAAMHVIQGDPKTRPHYV